MSRTPGQISAVVPCFNVGEPLRDAIESLLAQTRPLDEVIIVDDASTDPITVAIIDELVEAHPTVRVLRAAVNAGLGATRNAGADAARGDLVLFLDGDDLLSQVSVEYLERALLSKPEAGFGYVSIHSFGNQEGTQVARPFDPYLLHIANFSSSAALIRGCLFDEGVRYSEDREWHTEDWDFYLRAVGAGWTGVAVPEATLHYRRFGITMIDVIASRREGIGSSQRERQPDLFALERLLALKYASCPAVSILMPPGSDEHGDLLATQVNRDAEIVRPGEVARGRVLLASRIPLAALFEDALVIETLLTSSELPRPPVTMCFVRRERLLPSADGVTWLTDDHLRGGTLYPEDIVAVAVDTARVPVDLAERHLDDGSALFGEAARLAAQHPLDTAWVAGPASPPASVPDGEAAVWLRKSPPSNHGSPHAAAVFTDEARQGDHAVWRSRMALPSAVAWRRARGGEGLFPWGDPPSPYVRAHIGESPRFTHPIIVSGDDLPPLHYALTGEDVFSALTAPVAGTQPLFCVWNPASGEHRMSTSGAPPAGWLARATGLFTEAHAVPGTTGAHVSATVDGLWTWIPEESWTEEPTIAGRPPSLQGDSSGGSTTIHVYPGRMEPPRRRFQIPLVGYRQLWRALDPASDAHLYGFRRHLAQRPLVIEGPVFELQVAPLDDCAVPLFVITSADQRDVMGVVSAKLRPLVLDSGVRVGDIVGYVREEPLLDLRPVFLSRHRTTGDFLVSNTEGEGEEAGYRSIGRLGYARG